MEVQLRQMWWQLIHRLWCFKAPVLTDKQAQRAQHKKTQTWAQDLDKLEVAPNFEGEVAFRDFEILHLFIISLGNEYFLHCWISLEKIKVNAGSSVIYAL